MPAELPLACSLGADQLSERLAQMAALGDEALIDARRQATRAELRFAIGPRVRERIEAIVEPESECCPFLTMRVTHERDAIVLMVEAPEGAGLVLDELVAAFDCSQTA